MSSRNASIRCESVTKEYDGRRVVDRVRFEVAAGSVTGFVGANGAGKTTTMRMLLGLVTPTSGRALVNGVPYRDLADPRGEVGAVIGGPGAHPAFTARTHLELLATAAGIPRRRVGEVLDLVELTDAASRRVGGFSLGMLQRLALAGALLGEPHTLILDEPANGLDPPGMAWIRRLLRQLADDGCAVLVSSHLLAELAETVDDVLILRDGQLVAAGTLERLLQRSDRIVEVRCANLVRLRTALDRLDVSHVTDGPTLRVHGMSAPAIGALVDKSGAGPVTHLVEPDHRFEDVYFELAGTAPDHTDVRSRPKKRQS